MKPEDFLDPADFPDDLKWVPAHYKIHPQDPVYLLVAWHWRRVKQSEDTWRAGVAEMKAVMDSRVESTATAAEMVAQALAELEKLNTLIEEKPKGIAAQLESQIKEPLSRALLEVGRLEKSLAPLAKNFARANGRQLLAVLVVGVALGMGAAVILFP